MTGKLLILLAASALVATACGGDDTAGTTTAPGATTTTGVTTSTTGPPVSTTTAPPPTTTTTTVLGAVPAVECTSPEGWTITYPEGWSTNSGDVVSECSMFDPEPFDVAAGTDERVAAITVFREEVPYPTVASGVDPTTS